jgi:hypothetical protein
MDYLGLGFSPMRWRCSWRSTVYEPFLLRRAVAVARAG